jgi:hypothetical protein
MVFLRLVLARRGMRPQALAIDKRVLGIAGSGPVGSGSRTPQARLQERDRKLLSEGVAGGDVQKKVRCSLLLSAVSSAMLSDRAVLTLLLLPLSVVLCRLGGP